MYGAIRFLTACKHESQAEISISAQLSFLCVWFIVANGRLRNLLFNDTVLHMSGIVGPRHCICLTLIFIIIGGRPHFVHDVAFVSFYNFLLSAACTHKLILVLSNFDTRRFTAPHGHFFSGRCELAFVTYVCWRLHWNELSVAAATDANLWLPFLEGNTWNSHGEDQADKTNFLTTFVMVTSGYVFGPQHCILLTFGVNLFCDGLIFPRCCVFVVWICPLDGCNWCRAEESRYQHWRS